MNTEHPLRFIHAFLDYVDENGIFDEYDPDEDAMITSDEMVGLINYAQTFVPERLENEEAAKRMRALTEVERSASIEDDPEVVIDMRQEFRERMAQNGGARGILEQLVSAKAQGDVVEVKNLMKLAEELVNE